MFEVKLTRHQLKRLAEHKYSSDGISLLDPIMQRYWRWVVELIPLWWAPNSITLVGLTINIVTALILMLYSPDGRGEPPGWSYILCAVGLFTYQTLDAIDGKQARRTKSSTPLGELFDHGCDSLSIVFVVVSLSITLQLGTNPELLFFECFASMFVFYAAHWKTYCTGTLKFGLIDVTEGQLMVVFLFLITSQTGTAFWSLRLFMGLPMKSIFMVSSFIYVIVLAHSHFQLILTKGGVGRNGSTVAGTSVLSPLIPIGILIVMGITLWLKSEARLFDRHPILYVMSFGMAFSKITNKLVVAHMSKSEMEILDRTMFGPGLLFLNQYFDTYFNEYLVLWISFICCTVDLVWYAYQICSQMCYYMNIQCFSIVAPPPIHVDDVTDSVNGLKFNGWGQSSPVTRLRSSASRSSSSDSVESTTRPAKRNASVLSTGKK